MLRNVNFNITDGIDRDYVGSVAEMVDSQECDSIPQGDI